MTRTLNATLLSLLALSIATPARAGDPLLFEWSGTDDAGAPFSVTFTVTDVANGATGYDDVFFGVSPGGLASVYVATEEVGQNQVITDVWSDSFAGTFTYPTATSGDPYFFVEAFGNGAGTAVQMLAGADNSDIGLTYDGGAIDRVWTTGTADFPFIDPTTASSLADIFPVGTHTLTAHPNNVSEVVYDNGNNFFVPTFDTLTISAVPEPGSLALLGLAGLTLMRRRA